MAQLYDYDAEDNLMLEELGVTKEKPLVSKDDLLKKRNMVDVKGLASTALRFVLNFQTKPNMTVFLFFFSGTSPQVVKQVLWPLHF